MLRAALSKGLCAISLLAFGHSAIAEVTPLTGAFTTQVLDLVVSGNGESFELERYYNSRSSFSGMFGVGWGTLLDTRLAFEKGGLVVHETGVGRANRFTRILHMKEQVYQSVLFPSERVYAESGGFRWAREDGATFWFSTTGRLNRILPRGARAPIELAYDPGGKLQALKAIDGPELARVARDRTGKVESIGSGPVRAVYRYDSAGKLIGSQSSTSQVLRYEYSSEGKLSEIHGPGTERTRISYYGKELFHQAKSEQRPDGFTVEYSYTKGAVPGAQRSAHLTLKDRQGMAQIKGRYDYFLRLEPTGEEWPLKIAATIDDRKVEREFGHCCGVEPVAFDPESLVRFKWQDAVVRIVVKAGLDSHVGTGFFVGPGGTVVTNFHVMKYLKENPRAPVEFELGDGRIAQDFMVGECRESSMIDLCLLKLNVEPKRYFIAMEQVLFKGTPVWHFGNSGGERFVLGSGKFIGEYAHQNAGYIEVSNEIRPGDSGGPIFTLNGRLAGVSTLIHSFWNEFQTKESGEKHFVGMASKEVVKIKNRVKTYLPRAAYFR